MANRLTDNIKIKTIIANINIARYCEQLFSVVLITDFALQSLMAIAGETRTRRGTRIFTFRIYILERTMADVQGSLYSDLQTEYGGHTPIKHFTQYIKSIDFCC